MELWTLRRGVDRDTRPRTAERYRAGKIPLEGLRERRCVLPLLSWRLLRSVRVGSPHQRPRVPGVFEDWPSGGGTHLGRDSSLLDPERLHFLLTTQSSASVFDPVGLPQCPPR